MAQTVDDTRHVSILGAPVGEIHDVNIPATVKADEEWYGVVSIRNVGDSIGTFALKVTGPSLMRVPAWPLVTLPPGQGASIAPAPFMGLGSGGVTIKLKLATLGQGESYDVSVGVGEATSPKRLAVAGESFDVIVGPGTGPPEARLMNPNFPSVVGPDEPWQGTIEIHNAGARKGWFFWELKGDISGSTQPKFRTGLMGVSPGFELFRVNGTGPATFTIYWHAVEWVEQDIVVTTVGQHTTAGAGGELRNLAISKEYVQDGEGWMGGIQVWNIGDASGNFRVVFTGDITGTSPIFTLGPMEHAAVYFDDVGPKVFTITAQREVDTVWVGDDSRNAEACKGANCATAIHYVGIKHDGEHSWAPGVRMEVGDHVFIYSPYAAEGFYLHYLAEGKSYWFQIRHMGQLTAYTNVAWVTPPGEEWVRYGYGINILQWPHPHPGYP